MRNKKVRSVGSCAYCGHSGAVEDEHVLPRAWSGSGDAVAAEKLKVPACRACNNRFSKYEGGLLTYAGLSSGVDDEVMRLVAARAQRAVKPAAAGQNERDRAHRAAARDKLINRVLPWSVVDAHRASIILGEEVDRREQLAFSIPPDAFHGMAEKIARASWFLACGCPVPATLAVDGFVMNGPFSLEEHGARYGREWRIGRTASIGFASPSAGEAAIAITLWERLHLAAFVTAPGSRSRLARLVERFHDMR